LYQEGGILEFPGYLLKDTDELLADCLTLYFRVCHALETGQETILSLHVNEVHVKMPPKRILYLPSLSLAQQAVIDEHACELIPHRFMHQYGGSGRVHSSR
jgi:hypothetical protein